MNVKAPIESSKDPVKKIGSPERSVKVSVTIFIVTRKHLRIHNFTNEEIAKYFHNLFEGEAKHFYTEKCLLKSSYMRKLSNLLLINTAMLIAKLISNNSSRDHSF